LHLLSASIILLVSLPATVLCQTLTPQLSETTVRVPELDRFHEVIYVLWHDAWPKKDSAALKELLVRIEEGASQLARADLPGILRDKKPAWDLNIQMLQQAVDQYRKAVQAGDDVALLAAAEQLHGRYEAMVRTIRPPLKEVHDFHAELYMLYHYYLPEFAVENITKSSKALKERMAALNGATLPSRLQTKQAPFDEARKRLSASVDALDLAVQKDDEESITQAGELVHSDYQALEAVFE
jgi:hypothetical protein